MTEIISCLPETDIRSSSTPSAPTQKVPCSIPFGTNPSGWDAVYISPDNNVLIAWLTNGNGRYQGEELYDENMTFLRQVANK